jgi:hypothetical protein
MAASVTACPKSVLRTTIGTPRLAAANALPSPALRITIGTLLLANASALPTEQIAALKSTGTLARALASAFPPALVRKKTKVRSTGTNQPVHAFATG